MTKYSAEEFNREKTKMASDIHAAITDGEEQRNAAAAGDGLAVTPANLDDRPWSARARLADATRPAIRKARETAAAADGYVHHNPWTVMGVAAAAGVLIGILAARR
jgi:ElaB/YqjD/DUF883 family membrane-anchored ribosome-binding protein